MKVGDKVQIINKDSNRYGYIGEVNHVTDDGMFVAFGDFEQKFKESELRVVAQSKGYDINIRGVELHYNAEIKSICLRVKWSGTPGFGQVDLFVQTDEIEKDKPQKLYLDTEYMSDEFVRQLFKDVGVWLTQKAIKRD